MTRKILVTNALPYANGDIHLGHLVGYVQADVWVRYQRMCGHTVHYVCADDTHGTPVMLRAEKEGITPEALIARVQQEHARDFANFLVAFDHYHSTHSEENRFFAEDIYRKLKAAGLIEAREIEQFYDPVKGMFLPDRFIKGNARAAARRINTATTARRAAQPIPPPNSRTPIPPSPAPSPCSRRASTTSSSSRTPAAWNSCAAGRAVPTRAANRT